MKKRWMEVTKFMKGKEKIAFGRYVSYWFHNTPRRMLHALSYYKFAAKMIGKNKRILDVGCNEGFGTYLLKKECGYAKGIDFDKKAIKNAKDNFSKEGVDFECRDFLKIKKEVFDSIVSFDVIEHILKKNEEIFFKSILKSLTKNGLLIIGTPSKISEKFASKASKKGHINLYSHQRLENILRKYFNFVFIFSANDELIHTGFSDLAHYFIAIACKKRF